MPQGPTIKIKGQDFDVERDFTWRELLTVEELSSQPLGSAGALDSMAVAGAFFFVVLKRDEPDLTWEEFLNGKVGEHAEADDPDPDQDGKAVKRRPTKPSA